MIRNLWDRWIRFWFEPAEPVNLGICRFVFFGLLFAYYSSYDFSEWARVSTAFWIPKDFFKFFNLPMPSVRIIEWVQMLWKFSLLLSCLGLFTRLSTFLALSVGTYILSYPHNFGATHHYDAMIVLVLGVMAFASSGDAYSLDALIRRSKNPTSGEYTWPIRAVWVIIAVIFFGAGYAKLANSGLAWITSNYMQVILMQQPYHTSAHPPLLLWGVTFAQHPWIYHSFAASAVIIETGYPLVLFNRKARWFFIPGALLFVIGIRVLMGPSFETFLFCHIFWIPWDRVIGRITLIRQGNREKSFVHP